MYDEDNQRHTCFNDNYITGSAELHQLLYNSMKLFPMY